MPSPNDAARKASAKKQTPEKAADLTTQRLARKRSQDFATKIAGWNQAGGGIAQPQKQDEIVVLDDSPVKVSRTRGKSKKKSAEEVHIVVEAESAQAPQDEVIAIVEEIVPDDARPKTPRTPSRMTTKVVAAVEITSGGKKTTKAVDLDKKAWVRRKSKPQAEIVADVKLAAAPKKRVISDGHWRRDRTKVEEKDSPEKEKESTPRPKVIRASRPLNMGLKVPRSRLEFSASDQDSEPVRVRPLRTRRSLPDPRSPAMRNATPDFESAGTKVYIQRRRQSRQEKSETTASSIDKPSTAETDITTPSSSPPRLKSAPRERLRSRTLANDNASKRLPSATAEAYAKQITQNIKSSPVSPATPRIHGNRIQGWLANMPDPFTDPRNASLTPEPLAISKRKSGTRHGSDVEERDFADTPKYSIKREVRSADERSVSSPVISTAALKRRGAKHHAGSPIQNRISSHGASYDYAVMSGALVDPPKERTRLSSGKDDNFRIPSGQRLPAISSADTLRDHARAYSDIATTWTEGSVLSRASDGDVPARGKSGLKRRATKHDDLMSVLSMERRNGKTVRRSRRRPDMNSAGDIMNELSTEELKYQRELRTLVDGVIPVLLQHALSGTDASPGSRVFSRPTNDDLTRPIVDMGVCLERLKTTHKRIPLHEPRELLVWADGAAMVYSDYIKAWRSGFKDIVVNLAPAEESKRDGLPGWAHDLPRNKDGDLIDGAGERVDVAHLLKRPLIRMKYLAKTLRTINQLQPSANAEDMCAKYQDLIADAKKRVNEEQARLEDEAASSIDASRARDPKSLAPITGVSIDPSRSVRARDYFDMDLVHSSGQQLGCKIEMICRDDAPDRGNSGDILFCEISVSGRWLLFPPLPRALVSARKGERDGELIVMVRGFMSNARQWREVMSLRAEEDFTSLDWLQMLGSSPMPPRLNRRSSFNMWKQHGGLSAPVSAEMRAVSGDSPGKSRDPSPREIEVPIGERVQTSSRVWDASEVNSICNDDAINTDAQKAKAARYKHRSALGAQPASGVNNLTRGDSAGNPQYFYEQPRSAVPPRRPVGTHIRSKSEWTGSTISTKKSSEYSVWMPSEDNNASRYPGKDSPQQNDRIQPRTARPAVHRRTSSVPSMDLPSIPKVRQSSRPETPTSDRDSLPSQKRAAEHGKDRSPYEPSSAPAKLQKPFGLSTRQSDNERPPPPPAQSSSKPRPLSLGIGLSNKLPSLTPAFLKKARRPSSPLKHQYEPSSASDSFSDSDFSDDFSGSETDTSDSTVEENVPRHAQSTYTDDVVSTVGDLKGYQNFAMRGSRPSPPPVTEPSTRFSMPGPSLAPSESASQAPYRTVPPTGVEPAKTVACIFSWSERGAWDSLHPEECQVFVTPGLIEAFDLNQANSVKLNLAEGEATPSAKGVKPLIAFELTPLVPLRRGTAVDISVRSPPAANSLIRSSNNVMFRSRSPEETERLYALMNRARIDNPTYVALQRARGPMKQSNWGDIMDQRNAALESLEKRRQWWNLGSRRGSTYRSTGSRAQSTAATDSSIGTMNTAFSALRRFSGGSKIFNIAKSTIDRREGTRSSSYSGSLTSGGAAPAVQFDPAMGTPLGITNAKIRFYMRESPSKWRDMGAARLTVMLPPRQPQQQETPATLGLQKRILVVGKSKGETLLDVTLAESAFEKIARTGIAISVYEETAHVGPTGGVMPQKTTVFMVQMKSEREAAYTFGLVGKLRY